MILWLNSQIFSQKLNILLFLYVKFVNFLTDRSYLDEWSEPRHSVLEWYEPPHNISSFRLELAESDSTSRASRHSPLTILCEAQYFAMYCISNKPLLLRLFLLLFVPLPGIGYFTLPYLIHAQADHVHACEWNPQACHALRDNLQLNGVTHRCTVHHGDNRLVSVM